MAVRCGAVRLLVLVGGGVVAAARAEVTGADVEAVMRRCSGYDVLDLLQGGADATHVLGIALGDASSWLVGLAD